MRTHIKLGQMVRDLSTGVAGMATQMTQDLNGNTRICIQPKAKDDGALPESFSFDHQLVEAVSDGIADRATPPGEFLIELGDQVEDQVSGFCGIATTRTIYLNGCTSIGVTARTLGKDGKPIVEWFLAERLISIATLAPVATAQTRTGGPIERARR